MESEVYENAVDDKNMYADDGWDIMPLSLTGGNVVAFKEIEVPFDDELTRGLIRQYESEDWQKNAMSIQKFAEYYAKIGYKFRKIINADTGETIHEMEIDDVVRQRLCTWRVEMDFMDGYLRISPFDITFPYSFYNASILDRYAPEIVASAKEKGLVKCATISS